MPKLKPPKKKNNPSTQHTNTYQPASTSSYFWLLAVGSITFLISFIIATYLRRNNYSSTSSSSPAQDFPLIADSVTPARYCLSEYPNYSKTLFFASSKLEKTLSFLKPSTPALDLSYTTLPINIQSKLYWAKISDLYLEAHLQRLVKAVHRAFIEDPFLTKHSSTLVNKVQIKVWEMENPGDRGGYLPYLNGTIAINPLNNPEQITLVLRNEFYHALVHRTNEQQLSPQEVQESQELLPYSSSYGTVEDYYNKILSREQFELLKKMKLPVLKQGSLNEDFILKFKQAVTEFKNNIENYLNGKNVELIAEVDEYFKTNLCPVMQGILEFDRSIIEFLSSEKAIKKTEVKGVYKFVKQPNQKKMKEHFGYAPLFSEESFKELILVNKKRAVIYSLPHRENASESEKFRAVLLDIKKMYLDPGSPYRQRIPREEEWCTEMASTFFSNIPPGLHPLLAPQLHKYHEEYFGSYQLMNEENYRSEQRFH